MDPEWRQRRLTIKAVRSFQPRNHAELYPPSRQRHLQTSRRIQCA